MGVKTGFTLFSGGGGVDIAMQSLGVDVLGGIEYVNKIAQVARDNGLHTTTADILQCNPADFPAMDWLHASPPCPNFSVAKVGAKETENDFALARKVAEWAVVHKPRIFTLENVIAYRKSESWRLIENALHEAGYWVHVAHVNFADYGVPQTRKRMIVRAVRGGFVPYLQPTHHKTGRDGLPKWIGWYEAVEDLIPTLPDSKFAPWQLARLPDEFRESTYFNGMDMKSTGRDMKGRMASESAATCVASDWRRPSTIPSAFMIKNGDNFAPVVNGCESAFTLSATNGARAFIYNGANATTSRPLEIREPFCTITANQGEKGTMPKSFVDGKVVKMTPRALARFQSFPDWYKFPDNAGLATRIIGNAVPPIGFANVMKNLI